MEVVNEETGTKAQISSGENEVLVYSEGFRKFRTTASDGKNYQVNYYNLDVIISVKPLRNLKRLLW